jgi:hypothetical protein
MALISAVISAVMILAVIAVVPVSSLEPRGDASACVTALVAFADGDGQTATVTVDAGQCVQICAVAPRNYSNPFDERVVQVNATAIPLGTVQPGFFFQVR